MNRSIYTYLRRSSARPVTSFVTLNAVKGAMLDMAPFTAFRVTVTTQWEAVFSGRKALVGYQAGRVGRLATSRITSG
jgi:hypothetical protein